MAQTIHACCNLRPNGALVIEAWNKWRSGRVKFSRFSTYQLRLERQPETNLHGSKLARRGLVEIRGAFLGSDFEILLIEHIEGLGDGVDRQAPPQWDPLLHAQVRPVLRGLYETVARHDCAVRAQPRASACAGIAKITPVTGLAPNAGAEVVEAADLEATADLPNTAEDGTMALIGLGQA